MAMMSKLEDLRIIRDKIVRIVDGRAQVTVTQAADQYATTVTLVGPPDDDGELHSICFAVSETAWVLVGYRAVLAQVEVALRTLLASYPPDGVEEGNFTAQKPDSFNYATTFKTGVDLSAREYPTLELGGYLGSGGSRVEKSAKRADFERWHAYVEDKTR